MSSKEEKCPYTKCPICTTYHVSPLLRVLRCGEHHNFGGCVLDVAQYVTLGHVFCEDAILSHWRTQRQRSRSLTLTCPVCLGVAENRRVARLDSTMSTDDWVEKCKLFLRKLFLDDVCMAIPSIHGDTVCPDELGATSQPPSGSSNSQFAYPYSAKVQAKAKDVSARLRSIDKSIDAHAAERAAEELKSMYTAISWKLGVEDPILDLFGAFHDFIQTSVAHAFRAVAEKDKQLRRKDREIAELRELKDDLELEAQRQQKLVDESIIAASQAADQVEELRNQAEGMANSRKQDKQKIVSLQGSIQIAKTTVRLRDFS